MASKRYKAKDCTIKVTLNGKEQTFDAGSWSVVEDFEVPRGLTDEQFANKLDKEFMMEDYEEEAKRRGVSLERLFALVIQEALEPIE